MSGLKLVRPSFDHKRQYEDMMDEWEAFGGRHGAADYEGLWDNPRCHFLCEG